MDIINPGATLKIRKRVIGNNSSKEIKKESLKNIQLIEKRVEKRKKGVKNGCDK